MNKNKHLNELAYKLYLNLNDIEKFKDFFKINNLNIINILNSNNSIISLLIKYYITNNDIENINLILNYPKIILMKRDILSIINYYYLIDINKSINIFTNIFLSLNNTNINISNNILENKDIDFLINNKLYYLFYYIQGLYYKTSINISNNNDLLYFNDNNIFYNNNLYIDKLLYYFQKNMIENDIININNIYKNIDFDYILDGGNIIYSTNKIIDNLDNIKIIINLIKSKKILIILHTKYIKKYDNILKYFNDNNINYYLSPYNFNDDIFILWFFIKSQFKSFIISNDKFYDHYLNIIKDVEYNKNYLNQFKYILEEKNLNYSIKNKYIKQNILYLNTIKIINNIIYIPNIYNKITSIKLLE
jgi:hypothetical protein